MKDYKEKKKTLSSIWNVMEERNEFQAVVGKQIQMQQTVQGG